MKEYRRDIKDDSGEALAKGGRLATLALHRELRKQPPRPIGGSIEDSARARGWRVNSLSRSYPSGYTSALRTLGGRSPAISAWCGPGRHADRSANRDRSPGAPRAGWPEEFQAARLTSHGPPPLSAARLRDISKGRKFLTTADRNNSSFAGRQAKFRQQIADTALPPDAVQLNVGALATVRAVNIREAAGAGGYLAAQFLTYKEDEVGPGRHTMLTRTTCWPVTSSWRTTTTARSKRSLSTAGCPGPARYSAGSASCRRRSVKRAGCTCSDMRQRLERRAQRISQKVRAA